MGLPQNWAQDPSAQQVNWAQARMGRFRVRARPATQLPTKCNACNGLISTLVIPLELLARNLKFEIRISSLLNPSLAADITGWQLT